jgi:hypothetical protein
MKPFTLEWWLCQLASALGAFQGAKEIGHRKAINRWADLVAWIKERIINKYGE